VLPTTGPDFPATVLATAAVAQILSYREVHGATNSAAARSSLSVLRATIFSASLSKSAAGSGVDVGGL